MIGEVLFFIVFVMVIFVILRKFFLKLMNSVFRKRFEIDVGEKEYFFFITNRIFGGLII